MWMLGCLVYELCCYRRPFEGESLHSIIVGILEKPYEPVRGYSCVVERLIQRLLEKDPDKRASVEELLEIPELKRLRTEIQQCKEYKIAQDEGTAEEVKVNSLQNTQTPKRPLEIRKNALTINTSFDSSSESKASSAKSRQRAKQPTLSSDKAKSKHFVFAEHLFSPQVAYSPNRPILMAEFLRAKLGEEVFDLACNVLKEATDPLAVIESNPERLLEVIGTENARCLQAFKYIMCSNVSTPIHSKFTSQQLELLQHHSKAWSMRTPDASTRKYSRINHYQQNRPLSTRAQAVAGLKSSVVAARKAIISPLNSAATDVSVETPKELCT
eukprot:TRINITY_DN1273_c0_g2_i1.p1 TRINITY_DN1273_c0_g2~~TRINITY_DN1273_c0_g2_i1.p1  ORF type:complete len:328 (+),score=37.05 TRINITY_DN1273_c0_g2_i1:700-1683(+)